MKEKSQVSGLRGKKKLVKKEKKKWQKKERKKKHETPENLLTRAASKRSTLGSLKNCKTGKFTAQSSSHQMFNVTGIPGSLMVKACLPFINILLA